MRHPPIDGRSSERDSPHSARLRELIDKEEIRDLLMRYCRGVDRCDEALITGCFHEDAVDDHGDFTILAKDAAPLYVAMGLRAPLGGMHFLGNVLIELEGDVAFAESYFMSIKDMESERRLRIRAGRYVDRLERRKGRWGIVERIVADEWSRIGKVGEPVRGSDRYRYGSHDESDPVYAIRRGRVAREQLDDPEEIAGRRY